MDNNGFFFKTAWTYWNLILTLFFWWRYSWHHGSDHRQGQNSTTTHNSGWTNRIKDAWTKDKYDIAAYTVQLISEQIWLYNRQTDNKTLMKNKAAFPLWRQMVYLPMYNITSVVAKAVRINPAIPEIEPSMDTPSSLKQRCSTFIIPIQITFWKSPASAPYHPTFTESQQKGWLIW